MRPPVFLYDHPPPWSAAPPLATASPGAGITRAGNVVRTLP